MAFNFQATLYNPIFSVLGVPVRLYVPSAGPVWHAITGLDKTAGIDVGDRGAQVQTIKPVVKLRVAELSELGITTEQLAPGGQIDINGYRYTIDSVKLDPNPNGRKDGVVNCIVSEDGAIEDFESESESESE